MDMQMIKKIFCGVFVTIFFLQSVLPMECGMDDWHKRRIYNCYFPQQHAVDQNEITKFAERFKFFEALIDLVRNGNLDGLSKWCKSFTFESKDFDDFKFDEAGNSVLHYLVSDWSSEFRSVDSFLLDGSMYKNFKSDIKNVTKCVQYLKTRYDLKLEKTNNEGLTVMHVAASCGKISFIKVFFKLGQELLELKHKRGKTPLLFAAHEGQFESIKTLLLCGANVKAKDNSGRNIIHILFEEKKFDCCEELLKWLIYKKKKEIILKLLNDEDIEKKIPIACANEQFKKMLARFKLLD
jgi:Zn/Cd-binding protein ZinT